MVYIRGCVNNSDGNYSTTSAGGPRATDRGYRSRPRRGPPGLEAATCEVVGPWPSVSISPAGRAPSSAVQVAAPAEHREAAWAEHRARRNVGLLCEGSAFVQPAFRPSALAGFAAALVIPLHSAVLVRTVAGISRYRTSPPSHAQRGRDRLVAVLTAQTSCKPCHRRTEERSGTGHERKDDATATGPADVVASTRNRSVGATLGVSRSETSLGRHKPDEVGAVVAGNARMAGRGQQNACGFCSRISHVDIGGPLLSAKQPVEIVCNDVFTGDRGG